MSEKNRQLSGTLYVANDMELIREHQRGYEALDALSKTDYGDFTGRYEIIKKVFKKVGNSVTIHKPFHFDYGSNISIGNHFYANFDCILLDANEIIIGDYVFFGPRVSVLTAGHPIDAPIRNSELEFAKKIVIGNHVWIGGNVVINPGVTIGNGAVIGSGSVVTKDIPPNVVAAGNPCRILREISENDRKYWQNAAQNYEKAKRDEK